MEAPTVTPDEVAAAAGSESPSDSESPKPSKLEPISLFLEPRLFRTHILQAIKVLGHAAVIYVIFSAIGVLLFMTLYMIFGRAEYAGQGFWATAWFFFRKSAKVYWAYGNWRATKMGWLETVYRDCVGVCMLGKIVTGMMIPNNPIEFSEFFIVTTKNVPEGKATESKATEDKVTEKRRIKLRYWIMLPVGSLLHDPQLRVLLIQDGAFYEGEGELVAMLQDKQEYTRIRGVRSWTLDSETSKTILDELVKNDTKYKMVFMISGTLVDGRQYFSEHRYTIHDRFDADDYLSIRKKEYPKGLERKEDIPYKMYINFNMAYKGEDNDLKIYYKPSKSVWAGKKEITDIIEVDDWYNWVFKGIQGRINLIFNRLILWQYDKERPIFKKITDEKSDGQDGKKGEAKKNVEKT